jgi:hypothetical protein
VLNDDSVDQAANVSFSTAEQDQAINGRIFYDWQQSDYEQAYPYRFERVGAEVGFRMTESLRFVGDGGLESDLEESTRDGGLDTTYWHAGLLWSPDSRTSAEARFGQRFFGDSYLFRLSREVRYLTIEMSYSEDPQVETRQVALQDFDPGTVPPPVPGYDLSWASASPFIARDARLTLRAEGARTRITLWGYQTDRDYLDVLPPDQTTTGVQFNVIRDFTAAVYGELRVRYDDVQYDLPPEVTNLNYDSYQDAEIMLRLTYEAWANLSPSVETGFLSRSSEINAVDYTGYWLALRFRYIFR